MKNLLAAGILFLLPNILPAGSPPPGTSSQPVNPTQNDNPTPRNCCDCVDIAIAPVNKVPLADADWKNYKMFVNSPGAEPILIRQENGMYQFDLHVRVSTMVDPKDPTKRIKVPKCANVKITEVVLVPMEPDNGKVAPQSFTIAPAGVDECSQVVTISGGAAKGKWMIKVSCAPDALDTNVTKQDYPPLACLFPITLDAPCASCSAGPCISERPQRW